MMVAAISISEAASSTQNPKTTSQNESQSNPRRPPLLPSEKDNGINNPRRPRGKQVPSRYMSPSPFTSRSSFSSFPQRFPSPLVSRNSTSSLSTPFVPSKRSVSVDRRRPVLCISLVRDLDPKPGNGAEMSAASKLLVTSTRSLSVSFQGESFSIPVSKTKAAPPLPNLNSVRKGTPERRRSNTPSRGKVDGVVDHVENSKPTDQHRWPTNRLTRSLDCSSNDNNKLAGSGNVARALQHCMIDERRASLDGRFSLDLGNTPLLKETPLSVDGDFGTNESSAPSDLTASDTDSVSSGSTSGVQDSSVVARGRSGTRGIVVSARFWQETNSRLRRFQDPGSNLSTSPMSKIAASKLKRFNSDAMAVSPRAVSSPIRGGIRPASPSKLMSPVVCSSPSRGMPSPPRIRNTVSSIINNNYSETPTVLSFAVDVRRGKMEKNRIVNAHLLRLLYNRLLQWRFVNARTEAALLVQRHNVEKILWNALIKISDLRDTVTKKRHKLQLLKQKLKLASILKGQMTFLEDWASLDKDYSVSLFGSIEALKASTLRLPVVGGAIADTQSLKDALGSAVDVMHIMASSIYLLVLKVEEVNSLVTELAKVTAKERSLLEQLKDFLSMLASMQVKDSSLRTHISQHSHVSRA